MLKDIGEIATTLHGIGWESTEKEELMEEYNFTEGEACAICYELKKMEMGEGKISEATLRRMANLSREYDDLYIKTGLIGVGQGHIHLRVEDFVATFPDYETKKNDSAEYSEELSAEFNGVKFIAIR